MLKAKLLTGEIIKYCVYATNKDAFTPTTHPNYQYIGVGYFYTNGKEDDEMSLHFWVNKKNYSVRELQRGDKIFAKIGEEPIWVILNEHIANTGTASIITVDGNNINQILSDIDILYVEEGNTGSDIIKAVMAKDALIKGGFHLLSYVNVYNELPLKKGDYLEAIEGYEKENALLGLRNNHRVLNQGDLVFDSWYVGAKYLIVNSVGLNKTANIAINSIRVKKVI